MAKSESTKIEFGYFHDYESEQFAFYRIPKVLFTDEYFRNLSSDAKVLYGLMLDRMALSIRHQWFDEEGNQYVLKGLREKISVGHSTEYHDSKISLFSAQKGKCAISGEEFADAEHVAVWLKVPRALSGFERYKNMVLIHKKYLILLQELPQAVIKDLIKTLNITKKMLVKINSLREQANLSAII